MEIDPTTYYDNLKRYWRRRRYQRMNGETRKKMRVTRLGGGAKGSNSPRRSWKLKTKLRFLKFVSPIKLLAKLHNGYVDMMIRMAGKAGGVGRIAAKKIAKPQDQISMASCGDELVDSRLVLEIYKRLAASRQLAAGC
ncbi:hypothetical protein ACFX13_021003 [Malus domestica]|uniref:Uncharacterized protein n=1 Tax=Malus domestica TaxID=3750 RepID=A0A498HHK4_MALDO|nr:uncharacterized protein LOC114822128 [Malus domestica]RXH70210.1 hypothetical protein DVH24_007466 [Malus domestica]